jgi:hypothetical protein
VSIICNVLPRGYQMHQCFRHDQLININEITSEKYNVNDTNRPTTRFSFQFRCILWRDLTMNNAAFCDTTTPWGSLRIYVSEERIASILKVKNSESLSDWRRGYTSQQRSLKFFKPEDGDGMFNRNVGSYTRNTASHEAAFFILWR